MITINAKQLLEAVKKANKIKNRYTLKVCDTIELSSTDNGLKVYRFCMDIQYTETIEAKHNMNFAPICIDANELQKVLAKCKGEIEIASTDKLTIKGKYDFALQGVDNESIRYVQIPVFDCFTELASEPLEWLKKAMSKDGTRFVLNGIYFDSVERNLVATDGRRLHKFSTEIFGSAIVSSTVLNLIKGDCKIQFEKDTVFIKNGEGVYSSKVIEGSYPNYNQIVPTSFDHKLSVNLDFVKDSLSMIKGSEHSLYITADKHSVKGSMEMSIEHSNPALDKDTIRFDRQYLIDAVNDADVSIDFNDELKPVRYLNGDYMAIIMPMRA